MIKNDSNGNQTLFEADSDGDGIIDSSSIHTYDSNNRQTVLESDSDGDNIIDYMEYWNYECP